MWVGAYPPAPSVLPSATPRAEPAPTTTNVNRQKVEKRSRRNADALIRDSSLTLLWPKKVWRYVWLCWVGIAPARVGPFPPPPRPPPAGTAAAPPSAPPSGRSNQTPDTQTPESTLVRRVVKVGRGGKRGCGWWALLPPGMSRGNRTHRHRQSRI